MKDGNAGIIFDMDELLVDSRSMWRAAEARLFEAMGRKYDLSVAAKYKGQNVRDVAATLHGLFRPADAVGRYQDMLRTSLIDEFGLGEIVAMPGAVGLVRRLAGVAPMAVASGSPMEGIRHAIGKLGIVDCFEISVSSELVARGKPAPDVFLKAADLLGASPGRCLVFEDSLAGVRAAVAAGMKVFAVPSLKVPDIANEATRVFGSLADVTTGEVRMALEMGEHNESCGV